MLTGFNNTNLKRIDKKAISSCFETIKQIYNKVHPEQRFCIEKNNFANVIELCYFIIKTYVSDQDSNGVIGQFKYCKMKKIIKDKQSSKFWIFCFCVLICEWEKNIQNEELNIIIYAVMKMYLREIGLQQSNQHDLISFINCISSYLCTFNHFITNKNNYGLFKRNIDLMIYFYSKVNNITPIIFYINLLLDYFQLNGNQGIFENEDNNFLEKSGLISLIDFACEYNLIQECKITLLLNILYTNHPSKELLLIHPLNNFIHCFSNLREKSENKLLKDINYLGNQLRIIDQINTKEMQVNISEDLITETFYFKGKDNITIKSNFIKEIAFPCCILFTLKIIKFGDIDNEDGYIYFKLSKDNNPQQFLKFYFMKEEDSKFIKIILKSPIETKELKAKILIHKYNYVFFDLSKEKNKLLVSLISTSKSQNKKIPGDNSSISLKIFDFNQIELGTKTNNSFFECEIGKFILTNRIKCRNEERSDIFKSLKHCYNSVFISNPDEEIYMTVKNEEGKSEDENTFSKLFDVICYISPMAILQKNLVDGSNRKFYFSFPCEQKNLTKKSDLFLYQINNDISSNFHPLYYQSIFHFLFENEGIAYLDAHCEYYYQLFIQNKKRPQILGKFLPIM